MRDIVHTVSLRRYVRRYQIYYHHGSCETLVDESDDEIGHDYEVCSRRPDNTPETTELCFST